MQTGLAFSKSEARRLIQEGAIDINQETIRDVKKIVKINKNDIIKKGKHKFIKII
jgi:tyrosyl-tRNA synthetase